MSFFYCKKKFLPRTRTELMCKLHWNLPYGPRSQCFGLFLRTRQTPFLTYRRGVRRPGSDRGLRHGKLRENIRERLLVIPGLTSLSKLACLLICMRPKVKTHQGGTSVHALNWFAVEQSWESFMARGTLFTRRGSSAGRATD